MPGCEGSPLGSATLAALPGLATLELQLPVLCHESPDTHPHPHHHAQISTLRMEVLAVTLEVELGAAAGEGTRGYSKSKGESQREGKQAAN